MPTRIRLAAKLALLLTLSASLAAAQGPGGFGGGWGGNRNNPSQLLQAGVVQDELKLTDKQKAIIKQLAETTEKKKTQVRDAVTKEATAAVVAQAAEAAALAEANGETPTPANTNNGNNGNNGGGRNNRGGNQAVRQVVTQAMDALQVEIEAAFLKPLDAKQKARIKQISLQAEGVAALQKDEVIDKVGLSEEQVAAVQAVRDELRNNQRQLMGQLFNNNGGGGGPGGGRPDPAMFQTPEFQAKLKQVEGDQKKLTSSSMSMALKALTSGQRTIFKKMLGEPFDVSQVGGGMMARFRPQPAPGAPPTAGATPPATAATPTAGATPPADAPATAPAKTARKSLRDSRGGGTPPRK